MATAGLSANRLELLHIANTVAQEKSIDKSLVIEAIEEAIQKAARSRYGSEYDIQAHLDPQTGALSLYRCVTVVDTVENSATEITLEEGKKRSSDAEPGYVFKEELPPVDFGRVASLTARQIILQKIHEAERERQYNDYKDRVGEILNGIVKRVEYGNVIIDLGRAEGIIRRNQTIPRENLRQGDRVRAYLYEVSQEQRGHQIFLSRAHPQFMAALFSQEVSEIYDGIIEIVSIARDPGSRAKMAVYTKDPSLDPVGACVGMRGSRVQAIVTELQGERVDIIPWSEDPASFVVNALQPAEVMKVILDEEANSIEVVVPNDQLSIAIGRRGQNVRLATKLTGWHIDMITEEQEAERRQKEFEERTGLFQKALDVDEMIARLLTAEGFETLEEVAWVEPDEITSIEGFDQDTAEELQLRARAYLEAQEKEREEKFRELGIKEAVLELEGMDIRKAIALGEHGVLTMEDLAGLTPDDLRGWYEKEGDERVRKPGYLESFKLSSEDAQNLILAARVKAGWISLPEDESQDENTEET